MMSGIRWRAIAALAAGAGMLGAGGGVAAAAALPFGNQLPGPRPQLVRVNPEGVAFYSRCGAAAAAHGLLCYSPAVLQTAYGISPLLAQRIDGRGETVVLPEQGFTTGQIHHLAPHDGLYLGPSIAIYDAAFRLPAVHLSVDTQLDRGAPGDRVSTPEELLDVEMVHAIAPDARIKVDLVSSLIKRLPAVIRLGARQGKLISISYGLSESCVRHHLPGLEPALRSAARHRVSVFASAGDQDDLSRSCSGKLTTSRQVSLPGSSPLVTSVGGTQLSVDPTTGAYASETVWNQQAADGGKGAPEGTGGGFSTLFHRPSYQAGVAGIGTRRGVPDVAFSASQADGVEIVLAIEGPPCAALAHPTRREPRPSRRTSKLKCVVALGIGGTSVGSPAWAGIGALADQYAHHGLGLLNPAIYRIGKSASYGAAFHDITTGDNSSILKGRSIPGFSAGPGWDPVTGWGSPNASVLVPLLAHGG